MNMLPVITQIAVISTLVAFLWLTVRAFMKTTGWGLAVMLLSPFSAAFFGIKYWSDEKKPFLVYMTSLVTAITLALYLFTTWGGWELVRTAHLVNKGIQSRMLTAQDAENFMKASLSFTEKSGLDIQNPAGLEQISKKLASEAEAKAAREQAAAEAAEAERLSLENTTQKAPVKQVRYRLVYLPIEVADASNYVGSTVKVTRRNVPEKEYRLIGASGRKIELSQHAGRGSYSFKYNFRDIEKIRVLTKQPY